MLRASRREVAASIERFGFVNPVLTADDGEIVAGHGVLPRRSCLVSRRSPCCASHLSEVERRAYVIADNKLAQNARWDREILAIECRVLLLSILTSSSPDFL